MKPTDTVTYTLEKGADVIPLSGVLPRSNTVVRLHDAAEHPRAAEIVSINDARPPVWYDVAVRHDWSGNITTWVRGVCIDTPEDRAKVAIALRQVADGLDSPTEDTPT